MAEPALSPSVVLENVSKRFRQGTASVEAVRQVSLTIAAGEFVAVMGASGCGKSTLLHLLAGLAPPDSGRVLIEGTDLGALPDARLTVFRRRRIGLVFQSFNLIPSLTAEQNACLPLMADGHGGLAASRCDALLARLGLVPRRSHRPDALSGGEQQRVAIARALIGEPALVLADEPTGSLDSASGQNICRLLRELCEELRRTIVVVTHEPAVAAWAKRVVVMKDGRVLTQLGSAEFSDAATLAARCQAAVHAAESETGGEP